MERLMHETRETFLTLMVFSCLAAGIGGAVFYTLGPDGWLVERVRAVLLDPNLATLAALTAAIGMLALVKRLLATAKGTDHILSEEEIRQVIKEHRAA